MLYEFIEKVVVHEGIGRGSNRRQRVDIYLNFIGSFEIPSHIVTPKELEEQRHLQEAQRTKEEHAKEHAKIQYEQRKQKRREFTRRKQAGLLTPEEQAAEEIRLKKRREQNKAWRNKKKATENQKKEEVV